MFALVEGLVGFWVRFFLGELNFRHGREFLLLLLLLFLFLLFDFHPLQLRRHPRFLFSSVSILGLLLLLLLFSAFRGAGISARFHLHFPLRECRVLIFVGVLLLLWQILDFLLFLDGSLRVICLLLLALGGIVLGVLLLLLKIRLILTL